MLGHRKFIITLLSLSAAVFLAWFDKLDTQAASVIGAVLSAYNAANVLAKVNAKATESQT